MLKKLIAALSLVVMAASASANDGQGGASFDPSKYSDPVEKAYKKGEQAAIDAIANDLQNGNIAEAYAKAFLAGIGLTIVPSSSDEAVVGIVFSAAGAPVVGKALGKALKAGKKSGKKTDTTGLVTTYEPKIGKQMGKRGWSEDSIEETISNPSRTAKAKDTRNNPETGAKNNDPATAYINDDGSYVVRNDTTGDIVQVSNKNDPNWKSPFD